MFSPIAYVTIHSGHKPLYIFPFIWYDATADCENLSFNPDARHLAH